MINDLFFGKRRAYKVETDGYTRIISGRYFNMNKDGLLTIYEAWGDKVAIIRNVKSIIEIEE